MMPYITTLANTKLPPTGLCTSCLQSAARRIGRGGGNQVSAELIPMGAPEASISERLSQINAATKNAGERLRHANDVAPGLCAVVV